MCYFELLRRLIIFNKMSILYAKSNFGRKWRPGNFWGTAPGITPGEEGAHTVLGGAHTGVGGTRTGKGGALTGSQYKLD